jgi:hypothetical protein
VDDESEAMAAMFRYCCGWCWSTIPPIPALLYLADHGLFADDTDDELYEPLMDDNESNAISDLLVYLENVPPSSPLHSIPYLVD